MTQQGRYQDVSETCPLLALYFAVPLVRQQEFGVVWEARALARCVDQAIGDEVRQHEETVIVPAVPLQLLAVWDDDSDMKEERQEDLLRGCSEYEQGIACCCVPQPAAG
jgi:hypothetical protein